MSRQTHKRGCRCDLLPNGKFKFRLILFGVFSQNVQSQEINNISLVDLKDMKFKIEEAIIKEEIKNAEKSRNTSSVD
jgi:hypothetical protein